MKVEFLCCLLTYLIKFSEVIDSFCLVFETLNANKSELLKFKPFDNQDPSNSFRFNSILML